MYMELELIKKDRSRQVKLIYTLCSVLTIILKITTFSLNHWYRYCWWDLGLVAATNFNNFKNFEYEHYIIDVKNDACYSLRSLTDQYCSDFCNKINDIETGGMAMIILGSFSIMVHMLCVGFHLWNYFYPSFTFGKIWVLIIVPAIFNLGGFLSLYFVIKPYRIEEFHKVNGNTFDRTNFEYDYGFYLGITTVVFDVAVMLYGFLRTRKEFLPVVSG